MGVLNVTPDSFSDGGQWLDRDAAIARGRELFSEGADVVDVGGESTRPGSEPVGIDEECRRVLGVIEALAPHGRVSVDTSKAEVAEAAVGAGATIINDVSASLGDVAGRLGVGWIGMHMRGRPKTMQRNPTYVDVVAEVRAFLLERASAARAAGVEELWIDPGIGFGKTVDHNLTLVRNLGALVATGYPVLLGASRKSFLSRLTGNAAATDTLEGSVAVATYAMVAGAAMVRVHDVAATVQAARLVSETVDA